MAYGSTEQSNSELDSILQMTNVAEKMDQEERDELADLVLKGYEADVASRSEWEIKYEESMKLAMQVREKKSFPWVGASNVKFPLLSTAAMQFAARAYPALVPASGQVVNYRVIGADPKGEKAAKAKRVSQFMSWQVLESMPAWEEDMDKMLLTLPIVGTCFKKTYFDSKLGKKCSHMVSAMDLVVNYWAVSLDECERKTQKLYYTRRQMEEKIRAGEYLDVELPDPSTEILKRQDKITGLSSGDADEATPYLVLEQHRFYDLDGDGYAEPYVVTILAQDQTLLRVCARWASDGVKRDEKDKIICIEPSEYFTKYGFIPNPDGGFYDVGFGLLLGPLNESVNTLINQLIDAGTLSTLQGGWISKGLRVKQGKQSFTPGEWKQVDATLDDLKKGIFPLPVKEPSEVLFQLLGMLVTSTKELASVAEIMTGKMPGQNTPAYTTKETVEQGMKVFTAIYKRLYRALSHEFKRLYVLNQLYFQPEVSMAVMDDPVSQQDFQGPADDIVPAADPAAASMNDKLNKAKELGGMIQLGLNKDEVLKRLLEAMEIPNVEALLPDPNQKPPPPPEVQKLQMEQQMKEKEFQLKEKQMQEEHALKLKELEANLEFQREEHNLKMEEMHMKLQAEREKLNMKREENQMDMVATIQQAHIDQHVNQQSMEQADQQHSQKLEQGQAAHEQKLQQMKETKKNGADKQGGSAGLAGKPSNAGKK